MKKLKTNYLATAKAAATAACGILLLGSLYDSTIARLQGVSQRIDHVQATCFVI